MTVDYEGFKNISTVIAIDNGDCTTPSDFIGLSGSTRIGGSTETCFTGSKSIASWLNAHLYPLLYDPEL